MHAFLITVLVSDEKDEKHIVISRNLLKFPFNVSTCSSIYFKQLIFFIL